MLTPHEHDPTVDGALIRSTHVLEDAADAARAFYRPLSSEELSAVGQSFLEDIAWNHGKDLWVSANGVILTCERCIDDLVLDRQTR